MNADETLNKSLYGSPPRFFHDNPTQEFENFVNISVTNLDTMKERIQSITTNGKCDNIWDDIVSYKEICNTLTDDIKTYCVNMAHIDGEIKYNKRQLQKRNEETEDISQLFQECVVTLKQLENEKNEFTNNLINKHNAIRQATKYYKKRLNIHISVESKTDKADVVKICLFTQEDKDQFSINISFNINEKMKLEKTKPKIPETLFKQIQQKFNDEQNICALLCEMRKVFLSYK